MAEREWIQGQICFLERHEITSELIAGLEDQWNGLRGDRPMPRRDEIDPVELVPWLPYLSIVELHYEPFRVRYRIVGTEVARIVGEDFSRRWLEETGWGEASVALNRLLYERVAESRAPSFGLSVIEWQGQADHVFQWALFPVGTGEMVTHCLSLDDLSVISPRSWLLPLG
ncbi:PAS domain-containing protein [Dongia deserti]|uniref:PAS domain-containing protein n=1 Tax=Dongia deserti TaxID=2268030 RepID=UPI000E64F8EF|nr:PAS domain-containing protein [Dongia deserti]